MDVKIGRDTLIALAAVAWADGIMKPEEADGLRQAAQQLELSPEDSEALEIAIATQVDMTEIETIRMSRLTRLFTYAAATWISTIDGNLAPEEKAALDWLGDRLGLSEVARERARTAAAAIAKGAGGLDPYDLAKLRGRLSAGLSQIGDE